MTLSHKDKPTVMGEAVNLEPCPFCGGDAHWSPTYVDADMPGTVTCSNGCGATVICDGDKTARITAWNTRVSDTPDKALVEIVAATLWAEQQRRLDVSGGESELPASRSDYRAKAIELMTHPALAALSQPQHGGLVDALSMPIGASFRRDIDAWVLYDGQIIAGQGNRRIGQIDGFDRKDIVDFILSHLRGTLASNSPVETVSQRQARELMQPGGGSIAGNSGGVAYSANSPVVGEDALPLVFYDASERDRRIAHLADVLEKGNGRVSIVGWRQLVSDLNAKPTPTDTADRREAVARIIDPHAWSIIDDIIRPHALRRPPTEHESFWYKITNDFGCSSLSDVRSWLFESDITKSTPAICYLARAALAKVDAIASLISSPPAVGEGWVLVPRDDNSRDFADSALPDAMIEAGEAALERAQDDLRNYTPGETIDWDAGMMAVAIYRAMIAASPNPKGEA